MRETIVEIAGDQPELLPEIIREFLQEFHVQMSFLSELMGEAIRAAGLDDSVAAVCDLLDGDDIGSPIVIEDYKPVVIEDDEPVVIEDDEPIVVKDGNPTVTINTPIVIEDDEWHIIITHALNLN